MPPEIQPKRGLRRKAASGLASEESWSTQPIPAISAAPAREASAMSPRRRTPQRTTGTAVGEDWLGAYIRDDGSG